MKPVKYLFMALISMSITLACQEAGATSLSEQARVSTPAPAKKKKVTKSAVWKLHHYEVLMHNGKAVRVRLVRNNDRRVRLEAFPYGWLPEYNAGTTVVKDVKKYNAWVKAYANKERRRLKRQQHTVLTAQSTRASEHDQAQANTPTYNTGLGLGYNPSTGYVGPSSQCYNSTTNLNNSILNSNFSSQNTANSVSGQTNASASISASYGLFSASANASYSNSYMNSSNSGATYFNASSTFTATNTFYSLNQYGIDSSAGNNFSSECGSYFLTGTPVGMLVTGSFNWWTTSSSTSTSISASMKASYGLDSISAAVSNGTSDSSSASSYDFTITITGGGGTPTSDITTAYNNNLSNMQNCFNGVTNYAQYCSDFTTGVNSGVITGVTAFNTTYSADPVPTDLSGAVVFPNGLQGVTGLGSIAYQSVDSLLSVSSYSDVFATYQTQLNNYITILNQIATLYNRAGYLYSLLYDSSTDTFLYDPYPTMMDVANNYLSTLSSIYYADKETMVTNLGTCLNAASTAVSTACAPIIDLYSDGITSAYGWYSTTGPNPNGVSTANQAFAQQNTIALQYTGQYTDNYTSHPMDMVWAGQLPAAPSWGVAVPTSYDPSSLPALIGFADYPYVSNGSQATTPWAMFIPMPSASNTITSPLSDFVDEFWSLTNTAWTSWSGTSLTIAGANGCTASTFGEPCTLSINGSSQTTTPAKCSGGTSPLSWQSCSSYSDSQFDCQSAFCTWNPATTTGDTINEDIFPISQFFTTN